MHAAERSKRRPPHVKAKVEAAFLDYKDCCLAAEKLKAASAGLALTPEEMERMGEMWDSIQTRDVKEFL